MTTVNITGSIGQAVDILVENQGRIGYGKDINFNNKVFFYCTFCVNLNKYIMFLINLGLLNSNVCFILCQSCFVQ